MRKERFIYLPPKLSFTDKIFSLEELDIVLHLEEKIKKLEKYKINWFGKPIYKRTASFKEAIDNLKVSNRKASNRELVNNLISSNKKYFIVWYYCQLKEFMQSLRKKSKTYPGKPHVSLKDYMFMIGAANFIESLFKKSIFYVFKKIILGFFEKIRRNFMRPAYYNGLFPAITTTSLKVRKSRIITKSIIEKEKTFYRIAVGKNGYFNHLLNKIGFCSYEEQKRLDCNSICKELFENKNNVLFSESAAIQLNNSIEKYAGLLNKLLREIKNNEFRSLLLSLRVIIFQAQSTGEIQESFEVFNEKIKELNAYYLTSIASCISIDEDVDIHYSFIKLLTSFYLTTKYIINYQFFEHLTFSEKKKNVSLFEEVEKNRKLNEWMSSEEKDVKVIDYVVSDGFFRTISSKFKEMNVFFENKKLDSFGEKKFFETINLVETYIDTYFHFKEKIKENKKFSGEKQISYFMLKVKLYKRLMKFKKDANGISFTMEIDSRLGKADESKSDALKRTFKKSCEEMKSLFLELQDDLRELGVEEKLTKLSKNMYHHYLDKLENLNSRKQETLRISSVKNHEVNCSVEDSATQQEIDLEVYRFFVEDDQWRLNLLKRAEDLPYNATESDVKLWAEKCVNASDVKEADLKMDGLYKRALRAAHPDKRNDASKYIKARMVDLFNEIKERKQRWDSFVGLKETNLLHCSKSDHKCVELIWLANLRLDEPHHYQEMKIIYNKYLETSQLNLERAEYYDKSFKQIKKRTKKIKERTKQVEEQTKRYEAEAQLERKAREKAEKEAEYWKSVALGKNVLQQKNTDGCVP